MDVTEKINTSWGWTGIEAVEVVRENDFGNLLIRDSSSRFWRLCPEELECELVAANKQQFDELLSDKEFLIDWHMTALVEVAKKTLGELGEGRKYYLVIPGSLGGEYDISNIKTIPLDELISLSGSLAHQIKDLPPGAKVKLNVVKKANLC